MTLKGASGGATLATSHYKTSIELRGSNVTDGVIARLHGHKQLKELHIIDAKLVTNTGLTYIENLRQLEWLNLDSVAITDRGLFFLQQMTKLRGLQLTDAFVTSAGLKYLLTLKRLTYLELDGTNVDDAGLSVLAKLKNLRTLRLSKTAVTDKGIRRLQTLKKLRTLVLHDSLVTEACQQKLQKQLPNCEIAWSAYVPPPVKPTKLPSLFKQEMPRLPSTPDEPGWYLKLISDSHTFKINQRNLYGPHPDTFVRRSQFKPSQPAWLELLDW